MTRTFMPENTVATTKAHRATIELFGALGRRSVPEMTDSKTKAEFFAKLFGKRPAVGARLKHCPSRL